MENIGLIFSCPFENEFENCHFKEVRNIVNVKTRSEYFLPLSISYRKKISFS